MDSQAADKNTPLRVLASLEPSSAAELDGIIAARQRLRAVQHLMSLAPSLSLYEALDVVCSREQALGVRHEAPRAPTLAELLEAVRELRPEPVAMEAVWDGDTVYDWFVELVAILPDKAAERGLREKHLARLLQQHGNPAQRATEIGQALERATGVPFFFSSPGRPDDQAPRWWDKRR